MRTAWDDLLALADSVGFDVVIEHQGRPRPPLVCAPKPVDWEWSSPEGPMPEDMDEPRECSVHPREWWPCAEVRAGRGVLEQGPEVVPTVVMRPKIKG